MKVSGHYLLFQVGDLLCALPQAEVLEILPLPTLYAPPGLPPILAGFANIDGENLPVLEMSRLFQLPEQPWQIDQHLLRLRSAPLLCLIKRALDFSPTAEVSPLQAEHSFNSWAKGTLRHQKQTFYLLEPQKLLLEEEQLRLQALQEMVDQRLQSWEPTRA